ncbi:hypothetical protein HPB51_020421 [Rhipicephalus microplus]|uniref:Uncharacterized protein n=1 Tax=Rhipicephalus microplus TaxID=6941 RepID=A0A9J6DW86_RHIMP|nr:hypothetical protein HPB51_020421 [Rhipicephalus microplus]
MQFVSPADDRVRLVAFASTPIDLCDQLGITTVLFQSEAEYSYLGHCGYVDSFFCCDTHVRLTSLGHIPRGVSPFSSLSCRLPELMLSVAHIVISFAWMVLDQGAASGALFAETSEADVEALLKANLGAEDLLSPIDLVLLDHCYCTPIVGQLVSEEPAAAPETVLTLKQDHDS